MIRKIFGTHEDKTVEQLERCVEAEQGAEGVLCADGHYGYSQPVGGAVAYREHISPSGVGYDIGCGNKAVCTDIKLPDIEPNIPYIMDEIVKRISFGMGRVNEEPIDHPVFDKIREASFEPQRQLLDLAANQLGTVGAGNHYVDLFADELDRLWIGVHFGSRGFGHKTASGFLSLAQGGKFEERGKDGEMASPPVLFHTDSGLGQAYIEAMQLAGDYAYAGRDVVVDKVMEILNIHPLLNTVMEVHNHHNFAWREHHDGQDYWVVRKGCTPAFPGQKGFVGSTMGEESVILTGVDVPESADALYSTVHGAGRVMSRTQAAGKRKRVWECGHRDCDRILNTPSRNSHPKKGACPAHKQSKPRKVWRTVRPGAINFEAVRKELTAKGIELRGGAADEAPGAYKRLNEVLTEHGNTVRVLHRLRPLGVAMAGANTFDAFKD